MGEVAAFLVAVVGSEVFQDYQVDPAMTTAILNGVGYGGRVLR